MAYLAVLRGIIDWYIVVVIVAAAAAAVAALLSLLLVGKCHNTLPSGYLT